MTTSSSNWSNWGKTILKHFHESEFESWESIDNEHRSGNGDDTYWQVSSGIRHKSQDRETDIWENRYSGDFEIRLSKQ
jgi:hypothetical protein